MQKLDTKQALRLSCTLFALGLVGFLLFYIPTHPRQKFLQSEERVSELRNLLRTALEVKASEEQRLESQEELTEMLENREPAFDLWSFISGCLDEAKVEDQEPDLGTFEPRSYRGDESQKVSMVELKLRGVSLKKLVALLHKVYSADKLVVMYQLESLRPAKNDKGLDCNIVFLTPKT